MKVLIILPPFLPVDDIRKIIRQILPDGEILTSTDFTEHNAEVLVATTFTRIDRNLISRLPGLKMIQISSTGYDNVDQDAVKSRKIMLCNIPAANKESVAEHVIAMALAHLKNLIHFHNEILKGNWPVLTNSMDLAGKTFGIIGMGAIGRKLAERLLYFGTNTIYYDPVRLQEEDEEFLGLKFYALEELLAKSDIISLHVPLTPETRNFIAGKQFNIMKDGSIFINTSRGEVVDEASMIKAIQSKGIRAGIDVYTQEPPDFSSDLFRLDNVIFSPHIAGVTVESQQRFITETVSNVMKYVQGLQPLYRVL
ncbi:MAG: 2-hydroxyacid dehydrogenase [Candidatus Thermoplasmatota archaeon]|nr:2-hydroxyacid dehydrogenase [Candidatus Thermoplasmatota archaeon]